MITDLNVIPQEDEVDEEYAMDLILMPQEDEVDEDENVKLYVLCELRSNWLFEFCNQYVGHIWPYINHILAVYLKHQAITER